jgi:hypothetical protein
MKTALIDSYSLPPCSIIIIVSPTAILYASAGFGEIQASAAR